MGAQTLRLEVSVDVDWNIQDYQAKVGADKCSCIQEWRSIISMERLWIDGLSNVQVSEQTYISDIPSEPTNFYTKR